MPPTIDLVRIQEAATRIRGAIRQTPLAYSDALSELSGAQVFLKFENRQRAGSFKERGALNRILALSEDERRRGLVAASAGNHAQAVAHHATRLGLTSTIVMPKTTPLNKIEATERFGAQVVLEGNDYDDAAEHAQMLAQRDDLTFVHAFDDDDVIAGQGTLALELLELPPTGERPEAVIIPIGGGGLIAGCGTVFQAIDPSIRVIGVEPERFSAMGDSLAAGHLVRTRARHSIAEGLAVKSPGARTFAIAQRVVEQTVKVSEEELARAILVLVERERTIVEGAGAAPLAALLHRSELRESLRGKRVVLPLTGGNIDVNILSRIIERGLAKDGRLGKLWLYVPDRPGSLALFSRLIADAGANVMQIHHARNFASTDLGDVAVEITVETRGHDHLARITEVLRDAGFRVEREQP